MMAVTACYDFRATCDGKDCHGGSLPPYEGATDAQRGRAEIELIDEYGSRCRTLARRLGWKLLRTGHCLCPTCVRERKEIDDVT